MRDESTRRPFLPTIILHRPEVEIMRISRTISTAAVLIFAWVILALVENLYVRPHAIDSLRDTVVSQSNMIAMVELAKRGAVRLPLYHAGAALQPGCDQIAFCFDDVIFERAEKVIAFAPSGFSYEVGEVRDDCQERDCQVVSGYNVYLSPASRDLIEDVIQARRLDDIGCREFEAGYYRGKYCRQDIYYGHELVETRITAFLSKPWSYGFLHFDENFIRVADWRLNFLTGEVITQGEAATEGPM